MPNAGRRPDRLPALRFGPYRLEPDQRRLIRDGVVQSLQPKAMDLLLCLARHPGQLLSRDQLMAEVWPDVVVTDASLARSVRQVREVLGDDATNPRFVETVPKAGYRFIAEVTADTSDRAPTRRFGTGAAAALLLALAAVALSWWTLNPRPTQSIAPEVTRPKDSTRALDVTAINAQRFFKMGEQALGLRSVDAFASARSHFERALEEDPRHAGALAGLAVTLSLSSGRPPGLDAQRRIAALAERALSIDSDQALAHVALGHLHLYFPRRYPEAEQAYRRALELDPALTEAYSGLATLLQSQGRLQEANDLKRRALSINPSHATLTTNLALGLGAMGRYEEALDLVGSLEEIPEARPALLYPRVALLGLMGDTAGAVEVLVAAVARPSLFAYRDLAGRLLAIGDTDVARAMVAKLDRIGETCESVETRFLREAGLRMALGGEAMAWLDDHRALLPMFTNRDASLRWQGRLALHEGDLQAAVTAYRTLFPEPGDVAGWQGSLIEPVDGAHDLTWALIALGRREEAQHYLAHIQSEIDARWAAGYRNHHPLTLLEARNAALSGDTDRAVTSLLRAVEYGWIDVNWSADQRWGSLLDHPGQVEVERAVASRARAVRETLEERGVYRRLQAVMDAIPDDFVPHCPNRD